MLSEQDFLDADYKRFDQTTYNGASHGLQKCICDSEGKRYHITVWVYDYRQYRDLMPMRDFGFSPEVQFREGRWNTVDIEYHTNDTTTVKDIEDFYSAMWYHLGMPYYERYENYDQIL